jgi:hypothetical protein
MPDHSDIPFMSWGKPAALQKQGTVILDLKVPQFIGFAILVFAKKTRHNYPRATNLIKQV